MSAFAERNAKKTEKPAAVRMLGACCSMARGSATPVFSCSHALPVVGLAARRLAARPYCYFRCSRATLLAQTDRSSIPNSACTGAICALNLLASSG